VVSGTFKSGGSHRLQSEDTESEYSSSTKSESGSGHGAGPGSRFVSVSETPLNSEGFPWLIEAFQ